MTDEPKTRLPYQPQVRSKQGKAARAARSSAATAKRGKTRAGCRTCKVRRLKCDETRPACLRCTSTGRSCDGYSPLAIAGLPFDIPGTEQERHGYHYFRLRTATAILGSQDASYWTTSLLQLSYSQPAVKHALVAMASIHEALESTEWSLQANDNDRGRALRVFSWKQYNDAIHEVLRATATNTMPLEILIVLCLLFNQYDNFRCEYAAAYMHIKMGLKLIEDWSKPTTTSTLTSTEMVREHVAPMLCRLDVQACFLMHSEAHSPAYDQLTKTNAPVIPKDFDSFSQARRLFDHAASFMFNVLGKRKEDCNPVGVGKAREVFESWWLAFTSLVARTPVHLGSEDDRAIRLLRIYYNFARIVLDTHHDGDEMGFDKQTERFQTMAQQARDLDRFPRTATEGATQPFSFDISLASPLNFVGARCREPQIRRQAIALLRAAVKSSWNSDHCATIAQCLLQLEEHGLGEVTRCEDIPSTRRVRRVMTEVCFDEDCIKLTYVRHPYTEKVPIHEAILPLNHPGGPVTPEKIVDPHPTPPTRGSFSSATESNSCESMGETW